MMKSRVLPVSLCITWEERQSLPVERSGAACAVFGQHLFVAGGSNWDGDAKCWLDRVDLYDFENARWHGGPKLPRAFANGCSTVTNAGLEVMGGCDGAGGYSDSWVLETGTSVWRRLDDAPQNFVFAAAENWSGQLYVFGGCANDRDLTTASGAVWMRNTKYTWHPISALPRPKIILSAHASSGGKAYFFGGCSVSAADGRVVNHDDAFSFDFNTHKWTSIHRLPSTFRGASAVALDNGRIIILGGYGEGFLKTVLMYDTEQDCYQEETSLPMGILGAHFALHQDTIYAADGEDRMRGRLSRLLVGHLSRIAID